jgi:penicillin-binding protein 2
MLRRSRRRVIRTVALEPDEILLDVHNSPAFDRQQFEGRMEQAISKRSLSALFGVMVFVAMCFTVRLGVLQLARADYYEKKSEQNSLGHIPIFADRGIIYDRNGVELAWNTIGNEISPTAREYTKDGGFAALVGYVSYPAKDKSGNLWQEKIIGKDGIEKEFDTALGGINGTNLVETDVSGEILSQSMIEPPTRGENLALSIDATMQKTLFDGIKALAEQSGYKGGAGAVMDIRTGELFALTSYPEYDQSILSDGKDIATIRSYLTGSERPFLNRMTEGLYTPGSIVKPFLGLAALQENIISPTKVIHTTGELRIPNPYNPGQFSIFKDNDDHGDVDMRKAIAVSSNVYFYQISGGFGEQKGLGIANIEKYYELFGIGEKTGINISGELAGTVPSIAWKAKNFKGDRWRLGDTYHTAIGQYGFQVTPIQMLRAVAGIASRGTLVTPTILKNATNAPVASTKLPFTETQYNVIHDAMYMTVTEGSAGRLNMPNLSVGAKTGTAQIKGNTRVNSWVIGFFPVEQPRFAFTVLMEDGPKISGGAPHAFRPVLELFVERPELLTQ